MIQTIIAHSPQRAKALPFLLLASLALAGCQQTDQNMITAPDAAFKGQTVDGQVQPVANRAVIVGTGGARNAACAAMMQPKSGTTIRWSNNSAGPAKAEYGSALFACEGADAWTGVVFPSDGQDMDECLVSSPARTPHEYQGPCRWGWVETKDLEPIAG